MLKSKDNTQLRLSVGTTILGLNWPSPAIREMAQEYFGCDSIEGDPHLTLEIEIINQRTPTAVPDSLFLGKQANGNEFIIADGQVKGTYDPFQRRGKLQVQSPMLDGTFIRVFEQVLYQAYYSAAAQDNGQSTLVHSAGVIRDGNGFLFVGASETGKSTVATLSSDYHVLNDEINLVSLSESGTVLADTPFNGFFHGKSAGHAPLKAIFLLAHGPEHVIQPVSHAEAVKTIMSQIVPPIGLNETMSAMTKINMFDRAEKIEESVPVYRLLFTPDNGFWDLIVQKDL